VIVCLCRDVSDRAIRLAIEDGAHSVEAVGRATGAGTGCGCCRMAIAGLVALHAPGSAAHVEVAAPRAPRLVALKAPAQGPRGAETPPLRAAADRRS
jgi:bacterioferritin-associated ferredoxin